MDPDNIVSQMRKGMLEYCVLLILERGPSYPPEIIDSLSAAGMAVVEGTLYTLLNRLKREEKLTYRWQESPKGPPRKYYTLTPLVHDTLRVMTATWDSIANTVNSFRTPATSSNPLIPPTNETDS